VTDFNSGKPWLARTHNRPHYSKATHMTTIVLTRHGHVDGIRPQRFRGREDLTMTQRGEAECRAVAEYIAAQWRPSLLERL
jgi:hypothetical protein